MLHNLKVFVICTMGMWICKMGIWILWACWFWTMVTSGRPVKACPLCLVSCKKEAGKAVSWFSEMWTNFLAKKDVDLNMQRWDHDEKWRDEVYLDATVPSTVKSRTQQSFQQLMGISSNFNEIWCKICKDQILQHFADTKYYYLFFLCFDFCKSWRDFIFQQRSACWVFFNLDGVVVWGGSLERQPEILDAHEATLAVLIPDLKQDLILKLRVTGDMGVSTQTIDK